MLTAAILSIVLAALVVMAGAALYSLVVMVLNGLASLVGDLRAGHVVRRVPHVDAARLPPPRTSSPGPPADPTSSVEDLWHRMQGTSNAGRWHGRRPKTR